MPFYADLHIHSKFARATSADADLEHMAVWAARKGVRLLGTGDFTHPGWFAEIEQKLVPAEPGLFRLRPELERWAAEQWPPFASDPTRFLLQVEISTIHKKGDRTRKVHHCIYVPDLAAARRLTERLARIGNLKADGRPILGLDSRDLLEITLESGEASYLIPAHIWTPWFAVLGSKSGFDSIEECYGDLAKHIFAVETGLSSDPPMNWRLSALDRYQLVSNSDAHSPAKIGREACVFDCELDYFAMRRALETGEGYLGTVEFFPEEGKYHLDGHRQCGVCFEPRQTKQQAGTCPQCGKPLTVGVMHRVDDLADRPEGARPPNAKPFRSLVPLNEVLGEILRVGAGSRKVARAYEKLLLDVGPELFILERAPLDLIRRTGSELLAEGIERMRRSRVIRRAGFDGEYGVIRLFEDDELDAPTSVSLLFELPKSRSPESRPKRPKPEQGEPAGAPASAASPETEESYAPSPPRPEALVLAESPPPLELSLPVDPLAGLDPDQRTAASITDGPLLIIAGPGTGKTRTLTHRLANLVLQGRAPAERCLAVTFTQRAAAEMRERLNKLLPAIQADRILVTTFHGLGLRLLQAHGHVLDLPQDWRLASETERAEWLQERFGWSRRKAAQCLKRASLCKRDPGSREDSEAAEELAAYEQAMRERGWLDFDDLIVLSVQLLERSTEARTACRKQFAWISVDEFQDIDAQQYRLIRLLAPPEGNLCVIGDPDQAIYGFRGTDVRFFKQLAVDYPGLRTVQLRRNYRSGRFIVQGALQAMAAATQVEGRVLECLQTDATRITVHEAATDKAEAEFVVHTIEQLIGGHAFFSMDSGRVRTGEARRDYAFGDFAVLYRTDAQADTLVEAFARSGIPFQRYSHAPLIEHPAVRALLDMACKQTPADRQVRERLAAAVAAWQAELQKPDASAKTPSARSHEDDAPTLTAFSSANLQEWVARLSALAERCGADWARFESELALLSEADLWDPRADRVALLTLHASKGLEFPVVFITGCEEGVLPLQFGETPDAAQEAEERRLFFVGMTRARERLYLCHARRRLWRGQLRQQQVSRFVTDIERALLEQSRTQWRAREKPAAQQLDLFA